MRQALIHNSTSSASIRDDFSSHGGSTIDLGYFKNKANSSQYSEYQKSLLFHSDHRYSTTSMGDGLNNSGPLQTATFDKGLSTTKFGKGFQRRTAENCSNPFSEEFQAARKQFAVEKEKRTQLCSEQRSKSLLDMDQRTGYDIITGSKKGEERASRPQGKGLVDTSISHETIKKGQAALRDTGGRFFLPLGSGPQHEYRQNVLYNEGVKAKRYTSVIELGKKDLPSYGIEDQFSKSDYLKNMSQGTRHGLYEKRVPGVYTPRKNPADPSGNETIVRDWAARIDLNNNALSCGQQGGRS